MKTGVISSFFVLDLLTLFFSLKIKRLTGKANDTLLATNIRESRPERGNKRGDRPLDIIVSRADPLPACSVIDEVVKNNSLQKEENKKLVQYRIFEREIKVGSLNC